MAKRAPSGNDLRNGNRMCHGRSDDARFIAALRNFKRKIGDSIYRE
jgi:hypothetical protein